MKEFILLSLITLFSSTGIFAIPGPGAPEKIQKLFHKEFPNIENPGFFKDGDTYMVYFKKSNNTSERLYYNSDAEIILTMKYYSESELEPFIFEKVNKMFKGMTIFMVTEVLTNTDHFYDIIVQGNKNWYNIKCDSKGSIETQKRWKGSL